MEIDTHRVEYKITMCTLDRTEEYLHTGIESGFLPKEGKHCPSPFCKQKNQGRVYFECSSFDRKHPARSQVVRMSDEHDEDEHLVDVVHGCYACVYSVVCVVAANLRAPPNSRVRPDVRKARMELFQYMLKQPELKAVLFTLSPPEADDEDSDRDGRSDGEKREEEEEDEEEEESEEEEDEEASADEPSSGAKAAAPKA